MRTLILPRRERERENVHICRYILKRTLILPHTKKITLTHSKLISVRVCVHTRTCTHAWTQTHKHIPTRIHAHTQCICVHDFLTHNVFVCMIFYDAASLLCTKQSCQQDSICVHILSIKINLLCVYTVYTYTTYAPCVYTLHMYKVVINTAKGKIRTRRR
jgi:hypothetical protein